MAALASVVALGAAFATVPAAADPGDGSSATSTEPQTVAEAKQAWLDASDKAEAAAQELLEAQQHQQRAEQKVSSAKVAVALATLRVSRAHGVAMSAAAQYAELRSQVAEFASASFRGGRLSHLSALLAADSSAEYLDEMSSLDQVADSTQDLIRQVLGAKDDADQSAAAAEKAQGAAEQAKADAADALQAAQQATEDVAERKAAFDDQVDQYHKLYSTLSSEQRQAAMDAQRQQWERQTREAAEERARAAAASEDGDESVADSDDATATIGSGAPASGKAETAVQAALSKIGLPYVWGARGPNAFDCSGLTSWAWAQAGVTIPRTSRAQSHLPEVPLDELEPGDLVTYYSPVHHVAMYIGNGKIVEASTEGKPIAISSVLRGGPYPTGHRVTY